MSLDPPPKKEVFGEYVQKIMVLVLFSRPYFGGLLINSHKYCYEINKMPFVLSSQ